MNRNIVSAILAALAVLLLEFFGVFNNISYKPIVLAISVGAIVFLSSILLREKER